MYCLPMTFQREIQLLSSELRHAYLRPLMITGWERTGQMLCIVDTSLSVLMTLRMCLRELCCLFTVWI